MINSEPERVKIKDQTAMTARPATSADADAIAAIYNQGIEDRIATFETRLRTSADIQTWFNDRYPVVVVEENGEVVAFAAASSYRPRACYSGVAEVSVYVARAHRRRGAGRLALEELIHAAERAGFWKLLSRVFTGNTGSRALIRSLAFAKSASMRSMDASMAFGAMW
jgi:L-amino acid N-acyltransferase YncA